MYNIPNMEHQMNKDELVAEMREQLKNLEQYLGYGYVEKVQSRLMVKRAPGTIHAVKSGLRDTPEILSAIISVAKDERDRINASIQKP